MAKRKPAEDQPSAVTVELPIGDLPPGGYELERAHSGKIAIGARGTHVDAQLGGDSAEAFLRVRNGLRESNAKLASGRPVYSNADTLRYIMEQVADGN